MNTSIFPFIDAVRGPSASTTFQHNFPTESPTQYTRPYFNRIHHPRRSEQQEGRPCHGQWHDHVRDDFHLYFGNDTLTPSDFVVALLAEDRSEFLVFCEENEN